MNKAKKVLFIVLINIVSITVTLYGFEFLFNPYANFPVNGYFEGERYTWGHLVKNNKYGLRERNFETPKPLRVYRIMVLGDSLTWGAGLAYEERYTAIAEKLLNKAFDDRTFEIVNFGIDGGPTITERNILLHFKGIVEPDHIVVGFCLNDPQPKQQNYSVEREKLRTSTIGISIHTISYVMQSMGLPYLSQLLKNAFYTSAENIGVIPTWQNSLNRTYEPLSSEWKKFVRALEDIKRTSDELNLPSPIFAILNQGGGPGGSYRHPDENLKQYLQWYHQAEKAAMNIGFISYNHEDEIAQQLENESLTVNILDGHPSANVNRIYGEKLYEEIVKQITQYQ